MSQTALVTGASSGIGAVYADRLAARGYDLVLVARSAERLAHQKKILSERYGIAVKFVSADLTDAVDLRGIEDLLKSDERITTLINNAGIGGAATLAQSNVDKMEEMIAINVTALARLSYAIVPRLVAAGHGSIINISSIAAIGPEILNGVYGGTKAFVLAFSQSLKKELAGTGISVQVVLPGATATEFWNTAGVPVGHLPGEWVMSASDLVDAALAGFDRGEFASIPSLQNGFEWDNYESARQAMLPHLSNAKVAARYRPLETV